jgi:hypothetical protein
VTAENLEVGSAGSPAIYAASAQSAAVTAMVAVTVMG